MINTLKNTLKKDFSFLKNSNLLIAVSGGIDSVVLTHLLHQLNYKISIAHCNFNLRGRESDKDAVFVKQLALQLNLQFFTRLFNTKKYANDNKLSTQESARNLRYNWFDKLTKENQFDYILTAHNLNDNLETFLINLTRGTGLKGLTGIPRKNKNIIRPILDFSRKQITEFAIKNNIKWREDKSNADTKYTRNKIRHKVIPVLESINTNLLDSFKKTLVHIKGSETIINDVIHSKFNSYNSKQNLRFKIDAILATSNPRAYLYEIFKNYGFTEWDDALNLLTAQSGKQIFSKTHRLIKDRDYLLLTLRKKSKDKKDENKEIKIEAYHVEFKIQNSKFYIQSKEIQDPKPKTQNHFLFDKDLLKFPLIVRKWEKGDYFYPIGMAEKKKLSKFFKDEKYSLLEKENIWLLLSDNQIIWIIGKRQDNRFKITETTTQILEITQQ